MRRIVLHSALHPNISTLRHHLRKTAAEEVVRTCGVEWVIVKPAMYVQRVPMHHAIFPDGQLLSPCNPDTGFSVIDESDTAEIAARSVADPEMAHGTFEIAGPELLSMREIAAQLTTLERTPAEVRQVRLNELPSHRGRWACLPISSACVAITIAMASSATHWSRGRCWGGLPRASATSPGRGRAPPPSSPHRVNGSGFSPTTFVNSAQSRKSAR
ncbi:hypothetical protein JDV09_00195 [Mycobacterium sp. Y57]|nr:hypothetical protein [Mycolicibacterium xanthum]MBX7430533.1 hypothetical protein [Mycolicibacterium xanthum]